MLDDQHLKLSIAPRFSKAFLARRALQTRMAQLQHHMHSAEDDENAELFSAVLSTLDREELPLLASAILQRLQPPYQTTNAKPSVGKQASVRIIPRTLPVDLCYGPLLDRENPH